jgi:hypothetical protein
MADSAIKSRPIYKGLHVSPHARRHLFALEGEGALALADQVAALGTEFLSKSDILMSLAARSREAWGDAAETVAARFLAGANHPDSSHAPAGDARRQPWEHDFISPAPKGSSGRSCRLLWISASIPTRFPQSTGIAARRVQCVHCKGITENVTSSLHMQSLRSCLLVRDHYSRRIGAFQGVNIDAEAPGTAPAPEELFS